MTVRARFAPSPTGYLHVGSANTALKNWLFARSVGGTFVLRIEDTDVDRSRPELVDEILRTLEWLGLDWDEGPFRQSERGDRYRDAVEQLRKDDWVYESEGALRFRVPEEGVTAWDDVIRGHVEFENVNLEDFVVQRSNGTAMFLLANAVDDIDMGITHAIRGEDLVNTVPKVLLIMAALGAPPDSLTYAHLPLLVNERRKKLSKRDGVVAVEDYRARGYLPEALANYLSTLGWGAPDGIEVRPMEEIVSLFRLEDVTKASAFFDTKKLAHVNGQYLRQLSVPAWLEAAEPWLSGPEAPWPEAAYDPAVAERLAPEVQERVNVLAEVPSWLDWAFLDQPDIDPSAWESVRKFESSAAVSDAAVEAFTDCPWEWPVLQEVLGKAVDELGLKMRKAQAPVRVAVMGRSVGPPLWQSLEVLGRDRTLARLRAARAQL